MKYIGPLVIICDYNDMCWFEINSYPRVPYSEKRKFIAEIIVSDGKEISEIYLTLDLLNNFYEQLSESKMLKITEEDVIEKIPSIVLNCAHDEKDRLEIQVFNNTSKTMIDGKEFVIYVDMVIEDEVYSVILKIEQLEWLYEKLPEFIKQIKEYELTKLIGGKDA